MALIRNISGKVLLAGGWDKGYASKPTQKRNYRLEPNEELVIDDGALSSPVLQDLVERQLISVISVSNIPQLQDDLDPRDLDLIVTRLDNLDNSRQYFSNPTSGNVVALTGRLYVVDASSGPVTVTAPLNPINGDTFIVKKIDSSVNQVTIDTPGSALIDGESSQVIALQWTSLTFIWTDSFWSIV